MQYDGSVRFKVDTEIKPVTSQMQTVINAIKKSETEASRLQKRMEEFAKTKIPTDEYKEVQNQISKTEEKLNRLLEKKENFAGRKKGASWLNLNAEIQQLQNSLPYMQGELQDLVDTGKAFTLGKDSEQYNKMADKLAVINGHVQTGKMRLQELLAKQKPVSKEMDNLSKKTKKTFDGMAQGAKKSTGLLSTFASRFKGIMLSLLVFNWITKAFNGMVNLMKKGFENLMQYSGDYANSVQSLKNSMSTLGNQFAASFAPIIQMVIPWLNQLINAISRAMTYVAQFIAVLSGKNTFTRAKQVQDGYNKSLGGTAKAADKARGALAKFDDLDVWSKQEDASGGAGEGAGNMFEEVPVDPAFKKWLDEFLAKIKPIVDYVKMLKDIFVSGFMDGLGDYGYRLDIIKNGLMQIRDALIEIWTDPDVLASADAYLQSLAYMLGSLAGSIASIGLTIGAALVGGLGDYLSENTDRIKKHLTSMFDIGSEINMMLANTFQSIAYVFEAFASENGIRLVSALIGSIAGAAMGIAELGLKLGRDFLNFFLQPFTDNAEGIRTALEGSLGVIATIIEGIQTAINTVADNINAIYDAHFKPFFDSATSMLSQWVGTFTSVFNDRILPVLQKIASRVGELWSTYIAPLITSIVEFLGNLATSVQLFYETWLKPIIDWIIQYVVPILVEGIGFIVDAFLLGIEGMIASITFFIDGINAFIEDWNSAWENAAEYFDDFWVAIDEATQAISDIIGLFFEAISLAIEGDWDGMWKKAGEIMDVFEEKVSAIESAVRGILDAFFSWISEKVQAVLSAISSIGSAFSGVGSYSGGQKNTAATYSTRSVMSDVPHLASGAVIRGGNPFIAMLGDQPRGQTNIEAPLSTIRQAVREELGMLGNAGGTKVILRVNSTDIAEATLPAFISEMNRQGYDVDVLGGLT